MALPSGTLLGPYQVGELLGAGGMGEVYRAHDRRLDRRVAIKVLPGHLAADSARRQRFEREARAVARVSHPRICALHDVGEHDGTTYLVMELVEGRTLEARLAEGPLPLEQAIAYGAQIADALDAAHRQGVVHRDLKPANIMLTRSGVKVLDFGLARLLAAPTSASVLSRAPTRETTLTEHGMILGTLPYMAPEQLEGEHTDARTDIFALGAILYEMITGRRAFQGKSRASVIAAILKEQPRAFSGIRPELPPALERGIARCLAKDPEDRWQSARDVLFVLQPDSGIDTSDTGVRASTQGPPPHDRTAGPAPAPWRTPSLSAPPAARVGRRHRRCTVRRLVPGLLGRSAGSGDRSGAAGGVHRGP